MPNNWVYDKDWPNNASDSMFTKCALIRSSIECLYEKGH